MADGHDTDNGVSLGVHQAVEYLLGAFAFMSLARVEPRSATVCAGAGALLILLPAVSGGRLGVAQLVGPRLHRVIDYAAVPLLATSPWWTGMGWGAGGVWVVESLAVGVLWLARSTTYRRRVAPPAEPRAESPPKQGPSPARVAGRVAGAVGRKGPRAAGMAVGRIKKRRSGR